MMVWSRVKVTSAPPAAAMSKSVSHISNAPSSGSPSARKNSAYRQRFLPTRLKFYSCRRCHGNATSDQLVPLWHKADVPVLILNVRSARCRRENLDAKISRSTQNRSVGWDGIDQNLCPEKTGHKSDEIR